MKGNQIAGTPLQVKPKVAQDYGDCQSFYPEPHGNEKLLWIPTVYIHEAQNSSKENSLSNSNFSMQNLLR